MKEQQLIQTIARKLAAEKSKIQIIYLHKYVMGLILVLIIFIATFPLAYMRVSVSGKYNGGAFNTLDWQESQR